MAAMLVCRWLKLYYTSHGQIREGLGVHWYQKDVEKNNYGIIIFVLSNVTLKPTYLDLQCRMFFKLVAVQEE